MIALTRPVPASLTSCELTHLERVPIDIGLARAQHAAYERLLAALGCDMVPVSAADDLPDSVFVEDIAIVLDEIAIVTRPGAVSRRAEAPAVAATLGAFRQLQWLSEPATMDGGDVLRLDRTLYVGLGTRTNAAGARQLADFVSAHGYRVCTVSVEACLHLKSAVTEAAPGVVVVNPDWVDGQIFRGYEIIEVDPQEPAAANVLRIGDTVICAAAFARTNDRISAVANVRTVDVSELAKAEGAVTCCSVLVSVPARRNQPTEEGLPDRGPADRGSRSY